MFVERSPGRSYRADLRPPSAFRANQPGIATPQLAHARLTALDAPVDLPALTATAESLMRQERCTVTLGLGAGAFAGARTRPVALRELPPFPGDALDPAWCGGDAVLQVCADDPAVADGAAAALTAGARVRWSQAGHARADRRDPLGFHDGVNNVRRGMDVDRHVWVRARDRTGMVGGSYLVVRRIEIDADAWRRLPVAEQERAIGREKGSGQLLGGRRADLPPTAHAALASPKANDGAAMLRRGYAFDGGLLFLAFMADPRRQFVPVMRRLAEADALNAVTTHTGSAVFAIPPGARAGGFLGEGLVAVEGAAT